MVLYQLGFFRVVEQGAEKAGEVLVLMIWDGDGQVAYLRARADGWK